VLNQGGRALEDERDLVSPAATLRR